MLSPNKRIFLNIVATYGRSLYALVLGLFTARWALQALGQVDYGLYGVVGAMVVFVSFFNSIFASAVGRFYAVSVGLAKRAGNRAQGLEECRRWFNTAMSVHTAIPIVAVLIGYPLGIWAITHFLNIPPERLDACVWVWRFTCLSCFISMVNVPFNAMYIAKQEIAELTLYGIFTATAEALFLFYMCLHPGDWLARYAFGISVIAILPQLIVIGRAIVKYDECRINYAYWCDKTRLCELLKYVFARFWSDFSSMVYAQGQSILVNKYMGPTFNASMTIGNAMASRAQSLAASLTGALWPAIGNLAGEGRLSDMNRLCYSACRLGPVLMLAFAIPLALEVRQILDLWLVNPPAFTVEICLSVLVCQVFDLMTSGYWMAILARGRGVVRYSWVVGWSGPCAVVIGWIFFAIGYGMWSAVVALVVWKASAVFVRLFYGRSLIGFRFSYWVRQILSPILVVCVVSVCVSLFPTLSLKPSLLRIGVRTVLCEFSLLLLSWMLILRQEEKMCIRTRFGRILDSARWRQIMMMLGGKR